MRSMGLIRKIDELGRVVLPIEIRRALDLTEKDTLEIYVEGESIILKKTGSSCVFCGSEKRVSEYKGKSVCQTCLRELKEL